MTHTDEGAPAAQIAPPVPARPPERRPAVQTSSHAHAAPAVLRRAMVAMVAMVALATAVLALTPTRSAAQPRATAADSAALRAAALDYIEGWFTGDSVRMRRAVHPSLAKRIAVPETRPTGLEESSADALVGATGRKAGTRVPAARRRTDVTILDVFGNAASLRVDAGEWIDYLHLAKLDGRWRIVNVLWELRPQS